MTNTQNLTLEQIPALLAANREVGFGGQNRDEVYEWMRMVLVERQYFSLRKAEGGVVRELLRKVGGISLPQVTRLVRRYREEGATQARRGVRQCCATQYSVADLELLVEVDRAHGRLSRAATRRILERERQVFGQPAYARLAEISVGHRRPA